MCNGCPINNLSHSTNHCTPQLCICAECGVTAPYAEVVGEVNYSTINIRKRKDEIIKEQLLSIKHLVDTTNFNSNSFTLSPTEEEYASWFQQMKKSSLSLVEQKNLLQNITSSSAIFNNLSLNLTVKALLLNALGVIRMLEVPDAVILQVSNNLMTNIILNLILQSVYTSETNSYNYADWYRLLFQYVSLKTSEFNAIISNKIAIEIVKKYRNVEP